MAKRLKDKNAPKRPLSGFLLFGNDLRANNEDIKNLPVTQQAPAIAKLWKELNEIRRKEYSDKAEEAKAVYKKEVEEYAKTDNYRQFQKSVKESSEKGKKKRTNTKMSGYRLFVKENKENIDKGLDTDDSAKKYIAKCGLQWKALDESEKTAYNERAAQMNQEKKASAETGNEE